MKKRSGLLLALVGLLASSVMGQAEVDGLYYLPIEGTDNEVMVTHHANSVLGPNGFPTNAANQAYNEGEIVIPETIELGGKTFEVTATVLNVFVHSRVTSIHIGANVDSVHNGFCKWNTELKTVTFAENSRIKRTGGWLFDGCSKLESVDFPNSVTEIGWGSFHECTSLASVTLGEGIDSIPGRLFSGCTGLQSIGIKYPAGVPTITTMNETGLTVQPDGIVIHPFAELMMENITVYVPANLIETYKANPHFSKFKSIEDIATMTAPVELPENFDIDGVRYNVLGLGQAEFAAHPDTVMILNGSNHNVDSTPYDFVDLEIPSSVEFDGVKYAVTALGDNALAKCQTLKSLKIPSSVKEIKKGAFQNCPLLTSVEFSEGLEIAGAWLMQNTAITEIVLPNSLRTVNWGSFGTAKKMTKVTIGTGLTALGTNMFVNSTAIEEVTCLRTTPPTWHNDAFKNGADISQAKLFVPEESIAAYEAAEGWSGFGSIEKIQGNSLPTVEMSEVFVQQGSKLVFHETQDIQVLNVMGQVMYQGRTMSYELPQAGVYVVRTAVGIYKVKR